MEEEETLSSLNLAFPEGLISVPGSLTPPTSHKILSTLTLIAVITNTNHFVLIT